MADVDRSGIKIASGTLDDLISFMAQGRRKTFIDARTLPVTDGDHRLRAMREIMGRLRYPR